MIETGDARDHLMPQALLARLLLLLLELRSRADQDDIGDDLLERDQLEDAAAFPWHCRNWRLLA